MKISIFSDEISDDFSIELFSFGTTLGTQNMMMEFI